MHCIPLAFSQCFMNLDVCLIVEIFVLIGLDWVEPIMQFLLACHMFMHFHAFVPFIFFLSVLGCDCVLSSLSLSPCLSLSQIDYIWHLCTNLLWSGTLFIPDHLLLLIFPLFTFDSVMTRPIRTSRRTFLNVAFIRSTM